MAVLLDVVIVSLAFLFLWGLVAPRGQWRVLVSWSYRDPYTHEPSGAAYLMYRVIAALGIAGMALSGLFLYQSKEANTPIAPPPVTAAEKMWGFPEPVVVNRVFRSVGSAPTALVNQPILGYQEVTGQQRQPLYLFGLKTFRSSTATTDNKFIGTHPTPGLLALDTSSLVVQVQGDPDCFPQAAIVRETVDSVTIAIFYGQANPADHSNAANVGKCTTTSNQKSVSTLIPIALQDPLAERKVITLSGEPIRKVPLLK